LPALPPPAEESEPDEEAGEEATDGEAR